MRVVNFLLVAAAAAALLVGGYWVGKAVWQESTENFNRAVGETQRAETARTTAASRDGPSRPVRVALLVGGAIVVGVVVASAVGSLSRHRRRERWHA